jgi:hypothetical protein
MRRSKFVLAGAAIASALVACDKKNFPSPAGPTYPVTAQYLVGTVTEPVGIPLKGVLVTVTDGPFKGRGAQTGVEGHFEIPSVEGEFTLSFYKPDYAATTRHVNVADNISVNVEVPPVAPHPDVSGNWHVRFEPSQNCSPNTFSEPLAHVDYKAAITQRGARLDITFSDGGIVAPVAVEGTIQASGLSTVLSLGCDYYCSGASPAPTVMSRLPDGHVVVVAGAVSASVRDGAMEGWLDGSISLRSATKWPYELLGNCQDPQNRVAFTR